MKFDPTPDYGRFREVVKKYAPPWLRGNSGYRLLYTLGIQFDTLAEYLRIGCLQGFPSYCEEEALGYIGQDRKIRRGPSEPVESYRVRLKNFKSSWKKAGSPVVLLPQLAAYYLPSEVTIRYVCSGHDDQGQRCSDWWTYQAGALSYHRETPANWDWDGLIGDFRYWIIIYGGLLPTWNWDDPGRYWDEPGLLWGYQNGGTVYDLRNLIDTWSCDGTHLGGLCLLPENPPFDPWLPTNPPGYPMADSGWQNPDNRFPGAQYFFVPGD